MDLKLITPVKSTKFSNFSLQTALDAPSSCLACCKSWWREWTVMTFLEFGSAPPLLSVSLVLFHSKGCNTLTLHRPLFSLLPWSLSFRELLAGRASTTSREYYYRLKGGWAVGPPCVAWRQNLRGVLEKINLMVQATILTRLRSDLSPS